MDKKINVDQLHERWMDNAAQFAWEHLGKTKTQHFAIFAPNGDSAVGDPLEYKILGKIELPARTDSFLMHMARNTLAVPCMADECVKSMGLKKPPVPIFCLSSLLETSTPKSVNTQFFRGTIGCVFLGGLDSQHKIIAEIASLLDDNNGGLGIPDVSDDGMDEEMKVEINNHAAFYGLGVIIMRASREIMDPLLSNEQLVKESLNHYLGKV